MSEKLDDFTIISLEWVDMPEPKPALEDWVASQIVILRSKIARLVEVGDKMVKNWKQYSTSTDEFYCVYCGESYKKPGTQLKHSPDCPVTLWNKEAHE